MTEIKHLNQFLLKYGYNSANQPFYRLVWSDKQFENRTGEFSDFYGDLFIRTVKETRLTKKYSFLRERWILERWFPPEVTYTRELPDSSQGSYEPIYVFEDKDRNYLAPNLKVLEFIITMAEKPKKVSQSELRAELEKKDQQEINDIMNALDLQTDLGAALSLGEAVGYRKG